jgi:hypothetical protein
MIIATNVSGDTLLIEDLGLFLASGESKILTDLFEKSQITESKNLYDLISLSKIILNDGTINLNIDQAQNMLNIQTEYEIETSPPSNSSIDVLQFNFCSDGNNTGRTRVSSTSYTTVCRFIFKGSYNGTIPFFKFIAATEKSNRNGWLQLFDYTHNQIIFEQSVLGTLPTIYTLQDLSGITTYESIFEIKLKCSNSGDDIYLYSFLTQFS